MPYPRPTLAELDANQRADIVSRLPGTDPLLRRSYIGALSPFGWRAACTNFMASFSGSPIRLSPTPPRPPSCCAGPLYGASSRFPLQRPRALILVEGTAGRARSGWHGVALGRQRGLPIAPPSSSCRPPSRATSTWRPWLRRRPGNAEVGVILGVISPIVGLVSTANVSTALAGGADIESNASLRARLLSAHPEPASWRHFRRL